MSNPSLFQPLSQRDIVDLVVEQPFAWVVSGAAGALSSTPLPVQIECDVDGRPLRLLGHFARSNQQWHAFVEDPRATVLLLVPHGYVLPSWFYDLTRATNVDHD